MFHLNQASANREEADFRTSPTVDTPPTAEATGELLDGGLGVSDAPQPDLSGDFALIASQSVP